LAFKGDGWFAINNFFQWMLNALIIFASYFISMVLAGALVLMSQILIYILFGIGPFFIVMGMFQMTSKYFEAWISQIMTNIFVMFLITAILFFQIKIYQVAVDDIDIDQLGTFGGVQNTVLLSLQLLIYGFVFYFILKTVNNVAQSLGGGFAQGIIEMRDIAHSISMGKGIQKAIEKNY